nr:hypothetical protein [Ruminococcus albus]
MWAEVFKEAFYIAGTGRPGPVLIDVPMDVQKMMVDFQISQKSARYAATSPQARATLCR